MAGRRQRLIEVLAALADSPDLPARAAIRLARIFAAMQADDAGGDESTD